MTTGLGSELTELIPLALVITLSPLTIIPGILMLHTPAPRPTSTAFLLGWVLGIGGLTAGFVLVSNALGGLSQQPTWAPYVRIVIGAGLVVFGLYRWFTRNRSAHTPGWLKSMTSIGPARAFVTAVVLVVVNPKVLLHVCRSGFGDRVGGPWHRRGMDGGRRLHRRGGIIGGAAGPGLPVAGERLDEPLTKLKNWMEAQHADAGRRDPGGHRSHGAVQGHSRPLADAPKIAAVGLEDRDALRVLQAAFEHSGTPQTDSDDLVRRFYTRWFALDASVRDLFPPELAAQRAAFGQAMHWVFGEFVAQRAQAPVSFLAQLGRDHRKYGVLPTALRQHAARVVLHDAQPLGDRWTAAVDDAATRRST